MVVHRSLLLLGQVLEDQGRPDPVPCLHELTAFRDLAEINRRIAELLDQGGDRCGRAFIVARQEYDPSSAVDGRVFREDAGRQMVKL